jgi:hypothetical protein
MVHAAGAGFIFNCHLDPCGHFRFRVLVGPLLGPRQQDDEEPEDDEDGRHADQGRQAVNAGGRRNFQGVAGQFYA